MRQARRGGLVGKTSAHRLDAVALRIIPVNGSNWTTKRFQRVIPAAPTKTTSPGCSLNWSASANATGDFALRWYTAAGVFFMSSEPRITYTAEPLAND